MSKAIFWCTTMAFWLAVAVVWSSSSWLPEPIDHPANSAEKTFTPGEIARHGRPDDCWMIIRNSVFDFSKYVSQHPAPPEVITVWCGKEATEAFDTKMKGRPHSPYAIELLTKYRIGTVAATTR